MTRAYNLLKKMRYHLRGDVIDKYDSVASFIEDSSDASETLLSSCVPNLELDYVLVVYSHHVVPKLNPDGHIVLVIERILDQPG